MPEPRPEPRLALLEIEQPVIAAYKCVYEAVKTDLNAGKEKGEFRIGRELRKYLLKRSAAIPMRVGIYLPIKTINYDPRTKILSWSKT